MKRNMKKIVLLLLSILAAVNMSAEVQSQDSSSIVGPIVRSYTNDTAIVWFQFDRESVKAISSTGEVQAILYPEEENTSHAKKGEHVFWGSTVLGRGVYFFSKDYSRLRVVTPSRTASYYLRETPLKTLTPLRKAE